jgi:hypothetical protein
MADFRPFSDEKLDQYIASGQPPYEHAAAIAEREHRQTKKALQQSVQSHQDLIAEQQQLRSVVDSMASGQSAMKKIVDRIHRIDVWILIAGAIAAFAGVILLVVEIVKAFRGDK